MRRCEENNQLVDLPVHEGIPIDASLDLGRSDGTAMLLHQSVGGWINFIRSVENTLEDILWYIDLLEEWKLKYNYRYGILYLPHDGSAMRIDSVAGSTQNIFTKHGYRVRVLDRPKIKKITINRARRAFSYCRFDRKGCEDAWSALGSYRWEFDEKNGVYRDKPLHNWASHYADAFQTFAWGNRHLRMDQVPTGPGERSHDLKKSPSSRETMGVRGTGSHWNPSVDHIV